MSQVAPATGVSEGRNGPMSSVVKKAMRKVKMHVESSAGNHPIQGASVRDPGAQPPETPGPEARGRSIQVGLSARLVPLASSRILRLPPPGFRRTIAQQQVLQGRVGGRSKKHSPVVQESSKWVTEL